MKKLLVVGMIILLVGMSIPSTGINVERTSTVSYDGKTLYVGGDGPGNYSKIQDAIDNASSGDTVFVYNGTYYESLIVDESINLLGENKNSIIEAGYWDIAVRIAADGVNISGFTIQNCWHGIHVSYYTPVENVIITGNNLSNIFNLGIHVGECSNVLVSNNYLFCNGGNTSSGGQYFNKRKYY